MPHVTLTAMSGLRVVRADLRALGMTLPGLRRRAAALDELPTLALLTLAGMTPPHWSCSYHECPIGADGRAALVETIAGERPTLVAISALTASALDAYALAGELRQRGLKVVLGGLHATTCSDQAAEHFDSVVIGEGEPIWRELLADAAAGELKRSYRSTRAFPLTDSPSPRFDLLDTRPRPRFTLQTERGCPLACDFCAASRLLGGFREKPIENIRCELAAVCALAPRPLLELADDNTFAGPRDPQPLLAALAEADAKFFTEVDWRIGERPELLGQLAAAGCVQVLVGIESLVADHAGMGAKRTTLDRIFDSVRAIQEAGVVVNGCFIVGADGETPASLDRLTQFIRDSPLGEVQVTLQTPFPGTQLRHRLEQAGRLLPDRDWSHYTLLDVTYQPDRMSVADLERGFHDVVRHVFSKEATAARDAVRREIWKRNPKIHD